MSFCGSIVTFLILAMKPVTKRFFSPAWHYYVWLVVLASFACPLHVLTRSVLTCPALIGGACTIIENMKSHFAKAITGLSPDFFALDGIHLNIEKIVPNTTLLLKEQIFDIIPVSEEKVSGRGVIAMLAERLSELMDSEIPTDVMIETALSVLAMMWLAGVIATIATKLVKYHMFRKALISKSEVDSLTERIAPRLEIRRTSLLEAPLIIGLLRPVLYLPFSVEAGRLNLILRHELTHYHRRDILYKWAAMGVLSFHWFNPVTRIVMNHIDEECEISCDYEATKDLVEHEKMDYMRLILDMLSQADSHISLLTTQMSSSGKTLKRRFEMIQNPAEANQKRKAFSIIFTCVLIIVTLFAGTVLAGSIDNEKALKEVTDGNPGKNYTDNNYGNVNDDSEFLPAENKVAFTWCWPVAGSTEITNGFGVRENPVGAKASHNAVDIKAEEGAEIASSIKGTVSETGYSAQYGNYIKVMTEVNGTQISTFYAHLSEIICETGAEVVPGEVIGKAGATGRATGPHLHFEIMIDGEYMDPAEVFNL